MLRIALFLALVAGASATYPGTATCALVTKQAKCDQVNFNAAATEANPNLYCSCAGNGNQEITNQCLDTANAPAKTTGCAMNNGTPNICALSDSTGLDTKMLEWLSDDQKKCNAVNDAAANYVADETKCKAVAGCVYSKPAGVTGGVCYPNTDSLVATATGKGATAIQLAHLKLDNTEIICGPLAKDEATCNANVRCSFNKNTKTCLPSINYLVHLLDSGGCKDEAAAMAKVYNIDVATANAVVGSGAAGFSSLAVVVSALVAALSLIA